MIRRLTAARTAIVLPWNEEAAGEAASKNPRETATRFAHAVTSCRVVREHGARAPCLVEAPGFEPGWAGSEPAALPLGDASVSPVSPERIELSPMG